MTSSPEGEGGVGQKMTNDDMMRGGGSKDEKRNLAQAFDDDFFGWGGGRERGYQPKKSPCMFGIMHQKKEY